MRYRGAKIKLKKMGTENFWMSDITFSMHLIPPVSLFVTLFRNLPPSILSDVLSECSLLWTHGVKVMILDKFCDFFVFLLLTFGSNCLLRRIF